MLLGAVGLTYQTTRADQDTEPDRVTAFEPSRDGGIRNWGARTLSIARVAYIKVRRFFNYVEKNQ